MKPSLFSLSLLIPIASALAGPRVDFVRENLKVQGSEVFFRPNADSPYILIGRKGVYPAGKRLFHWTDSETANRWGESHAVSTSDMDKMRLRSQHVLGGGFYTSESCIELSGNSSEKFVTVEFERTVPFFEFETLLFTEVVTSSAKYPLKVRFDAKVLVPLLEEEGAEVVRFPGGNWASTLSSKPLTRILPGEASALSIEDPFLQKFRQSTMIDLEDLETLLAGNEKYPFLETEAFREAWPEFYKVVNGKGLLSHERAALAKKLGLDAMTDIFDFNYVSIYNESWRQIQFLLTSKYGNQFRAAIGPAIHSALLPIWMDLAGNEHLKTSFLNAIHEVGIRLEDIENAVPVKDLEPADGSWARRFLACVRLLKNVR